MPSLKKKSKKNSHHSKTSRHQSKYSNQTGQEIPSFYRDANFETLRLKCTDVDPIQYDESDTLSFRANLLRNFVMSSDYMSALTTQPVPLSMIRPPAIFPGYNSETTSREATQAILTSLQNSLDREIQSLTALRKVYERVNKDQEWTTGPETFYEELIQSRPDQDTEELPVPIAAITLDSKSSIDKLLRNYLAKYHLRMQERKVVLHKDKYLNLQYDTRKAPDDYWETDHNYIQVSSIPQTGNTPRDIAKNNEDGIRSEFTELKSETEGINDNNNNNDNGNGNGPSFRTENQILMEQNRPHQTDTKVIDRDLVQEHQSTRTHTRPPALVETACAQETLEPYGDFDIGTGSNGSKNNPGLITTTVSDVPNGSCSLLSATGQHLDMEQPTNATDRINHLSDEIGGVGDNELRDGNKPLVEDTVNGQEVVDLQTSIEPQSENVFGDMFVDYSDAPGNLNPNGPDGENPVAGEMGVGPDVGVSDGNGLGVNNMLDDNNSNVYQNFTDDMMMNQNFDSGELGVDVDVDEPFTGNFDDGFADLDNVFF